MGHEGLSNFVRASLFHALLLMVAFGTVEPDSFLEGLPWGSVMTGTCSIAYYLMIPVATQFPQLLFVNSSLSTELQYRPVGRLRFFAGVFAFWALMLAVFVVQTAWGGESDPVRHGIARWTLLVALAVFFSALDYAIPSYRRHVRLSESGNWGPRARVFTRR